MSKNIPNRMYRDYLARNEKDLNIWADNYATQLPNYAGQLGVPDTRVKGLIKAHDLLTHALAYQAAATDIAHVRTSDKDRAAWTPASQTFIIEPNTTKAGPIANETGTGGFFPLAIVLNDELFAGTKLTADIKAALRLNPLSKHEQHGGADGKPNYSALIKENHLTIAFLKEDFVRMLAKIDHGTGTFDTEYTLTRSPFIDPHPLPKGEPKIWRVQLFGFFKHTPITDEGIPGDIIDVAAKAYLAEHSEGAA